MKKLFIPLTTYLTSILGLVGQGCLAQKKMPDTINLTKAVITGIESKRMYLYDKEGEDVFDSKITFRKSDSSFLSINYKGQFPIPSNKGPVVINLENKCPFVIGRHYSTKLEKLCIDSIPSKSNFFTYYNVFVSPSNNNDCSSFILSSGNISKSLGVSLIHNLIDIENHLYQIVYMTCEE